MASLCTFPNNLFVITSKNPSIIFPNHSSPFRIRPTVKSRRSSIANFPVLSSAAKFPPLPAVSTPDAAVTQNRDGLQDRWQEIMGKNDWKGLLDPMDPLLRVELLKYGDFAASTYEGFISDRYARNYGVCNFELDEFFDQPIMPKHGYRVSKYIYCTSTKKFWPPFIPKPINYGRTWQQNNIWIGFIAFSDDVTSKKLGRRDICVVWRGTSTKIEWQNDFLANMVRLPADMPSPNSGIRISNGFLTLYTEKDSEDFSARALVLSEVRRLVNRVFTNENLSITVTGHSLGGALAALSAYDIVESGANGDGKVPVTTITYAGAKVGNNEFVKRVEQLGLKALRIVNKHDLVPLVPPFACPVGVELKLDNNDSPYVKSLPFLKLLTRASKAHDLELYLHLIDGYQGKGKKFELATGRDLTLINKYNDALKVKDDEFVTPAWRVEQNKSLVQHNGSWMHKSSVNYFLNR